MKVLAVSCLLAFGLSPLSPAFGQSLADVARHQAERERAVTTPARTYTNADITERTAGLTTAVPSAVAATTGERSSEPDDYSPARYLAGAVPPLPALAVGGGQVFLEVTVGHDGRVTGVVPLRTTPPFTDLLVDAVAGWTFVPAERRVRAKPGENSRIAVRARVSSKVLVAAAFRPPALHAGATLREPPQDSADGSAEVAVPVATVEPAHALAAFSAGVVLMEAAVASGGAVVNTSVIQSAPPYDVPAEEAAQQWRFRPARIGGQAVGSFVYMVFGFPLPVVTSLSPSPRR